MLARHELCQPLVWQSGTAQQQAVGGCCWWQVCQETVVDGKCARSLASLLCGRLTLLEVGVVEAFTSLALA